MSDRTNAGRSARTPRRRALPTDDIRIVAIGAAVIAILCILVGGHLYGRYLSARDLGGRDNTIAQLSAQVQGLKRQVDDKSAQLTELGVKLQNEQASLNAIMPSANTYNITPNQSLIVGDGHLTVGLVGAPGNETVTLNINGKEQPFSAGQVINVAPDAATDCRVQVESFDMFKAVLVASCTAAKPH